MSEKSTLAEKLHKARANVGAIAKDGKAPQVMGGFAFQAWEDVLPQVRAALNALGIVFAPEIVAHTSTAYERQGKATQFHHVVTMRYRFMDADNAADSIECSWFGESLDTGDKGLQKAATSATKYFLLKFFMIPDKDTDTDAHANEPVEQDWEKVEATAYAKSLKLDKEQNAQIKALAGDKDAKHLYIEAKQAGCKNFAEIMNFLVDGVRPNAA